MRKWGADVWVFWAHSFKNTEKKRERDRHLRKNRNHVKNRALTGFPETKGLIDVRAGVNTITHIMHARIVTHTHIHTVWKKDKGMRMSVSEEFTQSFIQPQRDTYCKSYTITLACRLLCKLELKEVSMSNNQKVWIDQVC